MDTKDVQYFKNRFYAYVRSFDSNDPEGKRNIDLKYQHTRKVCREAVAIGKALGLDESDLCIAEITALFHDVGRFEQYKRYKTFSDRKSVDHAAFGIEILRENGILAGLAEPLREFILKIISYHNRAKLPDNEDPRSLFFSRLLRDADKLDIWRVVTQYYTQKAAGETNEAIELDLPDTPGISKEIYKNLMHGEMVLVASMKNLNDFKLLQTGWVYDINFLPTLQRLKKRGYLKMLQAALPNTEEVRKIFKTVFFYVDTKLKTGASLL
ncbi:MAG: HD domain-containing protein [Deltaproteobacteria bacterium]|nr:HD domain-containing protein [Deltaproteobacteria bacterium]